MLQATLLAHKDFLFKNGIFEQLNFIQNGFEQNYVSLREKENRLFTDEQVLKLPIVPANHALAKEWSIRQSSAKKLKAYITKKNGTTSLLEVGCGNGWLCHYLSDIDSLSVVGIDVNRLELEQAARVFGSKHNLSFILGNVFDLDLSTKFDDVILPSSVQYFPALRDLIHNLLSKLSINGEIHIIDSPIYEAKDIEGAKSRSAQYFESRNSGMSQHYYHHSWDDLKAFNFRFLYNPHSFTSRINRIISTGSPFPWIVIRKNDNEQ